MRVIDPIPLRGVQVTVQSDQRAIIHRILEQSPLRHGHFQRFVEELHELGRKLLALGQHSELSEDSSETVKAELKAPVGDDVRHVSE